MGCFYPFGLFGRGYFGGQGQVQQLYCDLLMHTINFCFGIIAISIFLNWHHLGHFLLFQAYWFFLGFGSGSECRMQIGNFGFVITAQSFFFLIRTYFRPFWIFLSPFGAIFGVGVRFKNFFWHLPTQTNNFFFGSIALSCFFETFPGVWGWLDIAILMKTKSSAFDFEFD